MVHICNRVNNLKITEEYELQKLLWQQNHYESVTLIFPVKCYNKTAFHLYEKILSKFTQTWPHSLTQNIQPRPIYTGFREGCGVL